MDVLCLGETALGGFSKCDGDLHPGPTSAWSEGEPRDDAGVTTVHCGKYTDL